MTFFITNVFLNSTKLIFIKVHTFQRPLIKNSYKSCDNESFTPIVNSSNSMQLNKKKHFSYYIRVFLKKKNYLLVSFNNVSLFNLFFFSFH